MTKIEEFVSYASKLPAARLGEIESILSTIMVSDDDLKLSEAQEAEIHYRLSDKNPAYAKNSEIESILGKSLKS